MADRTPSPRKLATREATRRAVLDLLREGDYNHLTYDRIAAASGVAKTTLYRHWPTKAELVFDLVLHDRDLPSLAAAADVDGDVAALADRLVAFVGDPLARPVFPGVLADVAADPRLLARFFDTFVLGAQPELAPIFERIAKARGVSSAPSTVDLQAILVGSTFAWMHLGGLEPADAHPRLVQLINTLFPAAPTPPPPDPPSSKE
ncbi:MAG: TetR/AcrR family transcriptional regulator [Propionibacteriaceae bacterium]|nr:TetR/AcrR family transcriptional regulator [Micropruina sp.]HBX81397.1 hypothetical protein [Propionibacteriaceae bacterium]